MTKPRRLKPGTGVVVAVSKQKEDPLGPYLRRERGKTSLIFANGPALYPLGPEGTLEKTGLETPDGAHESESEGMP